MKVNRLLVVGLVSAASIFAVTSFKAQTPAQKVGFIDAQAILEAHPKYTNLKDLNNKQATELNPLLTQAKELQAKAQSAPNDAKAKADFDNAAKAYDNAVNKYRPQIQQMQDQMGKDIDGVIADVAKTQGFSVIMDTNTAGGSGLGLVVYADAANLDITNAVLTKVKALK